ncbi:hypothetical protein [Streptomyces katrae]|uniref:hypothetical protein n=1 Tax=Streptomyces katrae TaxID=68223 RepID=UPI00069674A0|nr:hypothetical protein [Streptomyces katrae]
MSSISMRKTTLAAAGLAVAGTLVLTGCKDGNEEVPAAPAAPSSAASAPADGYATPPAGGASSAAPGASAGGYDGASGAPAGGGAVATSGQSFKIGQAATIPFTSGSKSGQLALTVTSIEAGNPADLASLNVADKVKGQTPFYIHYTAKNTGTTDLSFASVGHIKGLLDQGPARRRRRVRRPADRRQVRQVPERVPAVGLHHRQDPGLLRRRPRADRRQGHRRRVLGRPVQQPEQAGPEGPDLEVTGGPTGPLLIARTPRGGHPARGVPRSRPRAA